MGEAEALMDRRGQRWIIISFFFLSSILTATWSSRIPDIQRKLDLSNAALGTVLFAIPVGLIFSLTVASWLIAFLGAKRVMLFSCIFCAIVLVLAAMASTTLQLTIILFLLGFVRTLFNLSANTSAIELQRQYERPIIASFHGIWSMACFIAAGIGTIMIIGNVNAFIHFLLIALVASIVAFALTGKEIS